MKPARLVLLVLVALLASCHRIDHAAGRQAGRTGEYTPGKSGGSAHRGARLIVRYGCSSCHTIPGVREARGRVGPPLDFFAERSYIGGELPNTPDTLVRWIMDAPGLIPATAMPRLDVSESDARDIAAYLYTLH
jgi:cytochrome c